MKNKYALSDIAKKNTAKHKEELAKIFYGKDNRKVLVI
jgi:3-deoxy-D-arabino-heptulosonate 7-phosphate (DAHP) synthase